MGKVKVELKDIKGFTKKITMLEYQPDIYIAMQPYNPTYNFLIAGREFHHFDKSYQQIRFVFKKKIGKTFYYEELV